MNKNEYFIYEDNIISGDISLNLSKLKKSTYKAEDVYLVMRGDDIIFTVVGDKSSSTSADIVRWCNSNEKIESVALRVVQLSSFCTKKSTSYFLSGKNLVDSKYKL